MGWIRRKSFSLILFFIMVLFQFSGKRLHGDRIELKNGNIFDGRIVREDAASIHVFVGGAELTFSRAEIVKITPGVSFEYFEDRVGRAERESAAAIARGDYEAAARIIDGPLLEIEDALKEAADNSDDAKRLIALRERLGTARSKTIPPNENDLKAERLFQEALKHMDFVQYSEAYTKLLEAANLAPKRADIRLYLAEMAQKTSNNSVALKAYHDILQLDAQTYYTRINTPYLSLLKEEGRRLVGQRKMDQAIDVFEDIILLESQEGAGPIEVSEFLARRATRSAMKEEEVLMEVFRYADSNDLVDLAFAAVVKIERIDSDNPEVQKLVQERRFIALFKNAMDAGDTAKAAELLAQNDQLAKSPEVSARVDRYSGDKIKAIEAQKLLATAEAHFAAERFNDAAETARKLAKDFPNEAAAATALSLRDRALFEVDIKAKHDDVVRMVDDYEYDAAEAKLGEIRSAEDLTRSVQEPKFAALEARIPRERRADELWMLAKLSLDEDRFEEALKQLEDLAAGYGDTRSGQSAQKWLTEYRNKLMRKSVEYQPRGTDYVAALTDPNYWRAAAIPEVSAARVRVPPIESEHHRNAMAAFNALMAADHGAEKETRSLIFWFGIPVGLAVIMLIVLLTRLAPRGVGHFHFADDRQSRDGTEQERTCRACGHYIGEELLACGACGASRSLSEDEEAREADEKRRSDFDPWKQRVQVEELNEFHKYFDQAKELAQTSDAQAAIDLCREALHEDPRRVEGYTLLAELYERVGDKEQAALCYREILLLDPGDAMARQKLGSIEAPPYINAGPIPIFLTICTWWTVAFASIGFDGEMILARIGLSLLGAALMYGFIVVRQKNYRVTIKVKPAMDIDVDRHLPEQRLTWKDQAKQAKLLSEVIEEHVGVEVPVISPYAMLRVVIMSVLLMAAMGFFVYNGAPWYLLLAWPSATILLIYVMVIYPRLVTANVILRHLMEEVFAPWADPHKPFVPKGLATEPHGEFLIENREELPVRWAFNPRPYSSDCQGVLNNIMQVLNRHWAFHRFYGAARVRGDFSIPMPAGAGIAKTIAILSFMVLFAGLGIQWQQASTIPADYDEAMRVGYGYLLEGDITAANQYFNRAALIYPDRAAPHLYTAHAYSAAGMDSGAEKAFLATVRRAAGIPQAHNDFANFLQKQGRLRDSIPYYLAALEDDPNNADILSNCGSAHYKLQEYTEAAQYLRKATAADPKHSRAFTTLGLVLERLADLDGARSAYETAIAVAPDTAYTNVARDRIAADLANEDLTPLRLEEITPKQAGGGSGR